ncbi:MAG: chitobiase/beta-hexosaminidase C-terminal domain-containing protein, partial [Bacteroidales bacterium]|nr:chitobiase/beta-hexosaminidase C-terminal domain-containing protein [Bacteroidales bacterium]
KILIPIVDLETGTHEMLCKFVKKKGSASSLAFKLQILNPKPNEVKINRITGGLIVDGEPFFPFGFYCYSPVQKSIAEEETVNGFNMMSPYQKLEDKTLDARRDYMDRCARLGMKVHYNLLSVAGGGGVGSGRPGDLTPHQKRVLLAKEIKEFKDHPALLAWYVSDEPVGHGFPPEALIDMYNFIRKLDPYHPLTIVFMTPAKAREYADAMDIVMADPYPVPTYPVTDVGRVTARLKKEFLMEKPVWIVPQAFGGNESWRREPTAAEIRSMTYQALVKGATGIQYFVRHGSNFFPKSVVAWNECSNIAHEVAELTPELTQGTLVSNVKSPTSGIYVRALKYKDYLTVIAVNVKNKPVKYQIQLDQTYPDKYARLIFENRKLRLNGRTINDMIEGYGSKVYKIRLKKEQAGIRSIYSENMFYNSGFEEFHSPGLVSGVYARNHGGPGATYFLDSRVSFEGAHSIRLVTPVDKKGVGLSFYPIVAKVGYSVTLSIWAKSKKEGPAWEPFEPNFLKRLIEYSFGFNQSQRFKMGLAGIAYKEFELTTEWKNYEMSVFIDSIPGRMSRLNPSIELLTKGTAWFDQLEVYPDMELSSTVRDTIVEVKLKNIKGKGEIYYSIDGSMTDIPYSKSILISKSMELNAAIIDNGEEKGRLRKDFVIHEGLGARLVFKYPYSRRFRSSGSKAATDGQIASSYYRDGLWLGFLEKDVVATVDLKKTILLKDISVSFLQYLRQYILLPQEIEFSISMDGKNFETVYSVSDTSQFSLGQMSHKKSYTAHLKNKEARYLRIEAKNHGTTPEWLSPAGKKIWLFMDEIIINNKKGQ